MVNTVDVSLKLGYIKIPQSMIKEVEDMKALKPSETVLLCTGSQGEPMAALSRIANGMFKGLSIDPGDTVVFSSSPIPGNGASISRIVNQLTRRGANVITNSVFVDIHSSGHPSRQELRMNLKLYNPKYFMPAHGEYHMLKLHGDIAHSLGIPMENIFILGNGDTLLLKNHEIIDGDRIMAEDVYIDGYDINGVSTAVINDRKILQDDGMVSVLLVINSKESKLVCDPRVTTVGFVSYGKYEDHLTRHAAIQVKEALNELSFESVFLDNNLNVVQANKLFYKPSRGKMNAKRAAKEISFFAALLFTPISMGASTAILNMNLFENKYITATLSAVLKSDNKVHTKLILFTYDKIDGRDFFGYRTVFAEKEPYNEMYKLIKEKISNKEIK